MRVRLVSGPAGSGKTFRCLAEIRDLLLAEPEGPPLLLITPKQTTYILERQLLSDPELAGYTRLQIVSFERLAHQIFQWFGLPPPQIIDEQGRLMVLRAILAQKRDSLKIFRASARLTGFAQQLSRVLTEIQKRQISPGALQKLAEQTRELPALSFKLDDLATLLEAYLGWLDAHKLQDTDSLVSKASEVLSGIDVGRAQSSSSARSKYTRAEPDLCAPRNRAGGAAANRAQANDPQLDLFSNQRKARPMLFEKLWVDGFAHLPNQEMELLAALLPYGKEGTIMLCLDRMVREDVSWLSTWSVVGKTFVECRRRLGKVPGIQIVAETLRRDSVHTRFAGNPVIQYLEKNWGEPQNQTQSSTAPSPKNFLSIASCADPDAEALLAGREILRHIRRGGRFREVSILVRRLKDYQEPLRRALSRFQIPFFMDQREPVSHHPLPELTRNSLRTITFGWLHEDWFAALKTGLAPSVQGEIDKLENLALARGWSGDIWQKPITVPDEPDLTAWLADWNKRVLPAFQSLAASLRAPNARVTGPQLAKSLKAFWDSFDVEQQLKRWAATEPVSAQSGNAGSMHETVWQQMNTVLENIEMAFTNEPLTLREWLPVLEAALGSLTVGVVPPSLDQVLVGAIDRSRNPEIKLGIVLGLNEGMFPAPPESSAILSDSDHSELERHGLALSLGFRQQLGQERFFGYIAFTRARERLIVTSSRQDSNGSPLNPSPFVRQLTRLFPALQIKEIPEALDWRESEHPSEMIGKFLHLRREKTEVNEVCPVEIEKIPGLSAVLQRLDHFDQSNGKDFIEPELASRLFGMKLRTSVSRLEQFAACPFQFFIRSGLRAEERKRFELDPKEQGLFQHDVLSLFHQQLQRRNKRWRDVSGSEAREMIGELAETLASNYRDGLLHATQRSKFMLGLMTRSLQDFIETLVGWMQEQYQFDPVAVELPFGVEQIGQPWEMDLGNGHFLVLQGRIDRVDIHQPSKTGPAFCIVVDYKSAQKRLDPVFLSNGLQLQLLTYLSVLKRWSNPAEIFGASTIIPAGVFYVSLRGQYKPQSNRSAALEKTEESRQSAYRHNGRFSADILRLMDSRPGAKNGTQFNYRINADGAVSANSKEVLSKSDFEALLDSIELQLKQMGERIFSGDVRVAPYKKGSLTACRQCSYKGICRIDPWTHRYRVLTRPNGV